MPSSVTAPTSEALQAVLHRIITRLLKLLTRCGVLVEEEGSTYMADNDCDSDKARLLRPPQAATCAYRIAFGLRAGQEVLTVQGAMPRDADFKQHLRKSTASACLPMCAVTPTNASRWSSCAATEGPPPRASSWIGPAASGRRFQSRGCRFRVGSASAAESTPDVPPASGIDQGRKTVID